MLSVTFHDATEIRMGSPFNSCRLSLKGDWVPKIDLDDYQDKYAQGLEKDLVCLVKWDIDEKNNPGFRLVLLDNRKKTVTTSPRIAGCCQSLEWANGSFRWTTLSGTSGVISGENKVPGTKGTGAASP
jgi:hypothetical protein